MRRARTLLASRADHWSIHAITPRVVGFARGPFPGEPIRALDAIHLATALVIRDIYPDLRVLSLDQRVRDNAVALGFEVVPGWIRVGGIPRLASGDPVRLAVLLYPWGLRSSSLWTKSRGVRPAMHPG